MELLVVRREPRRRLEFRNCCRYVSAFQLNLAEIVMRFGIGWTELNSGAKFFEGALFFSLLSEYFAEGAMDIGNLRVCLLEGSQALYAVGDSPAPDQRLCVDVLRLGSEFDLSDDGFQR